MTKNKLLQLLESQNYRCALSGRKLTPAVASLDHRVPLARGGSHDADNAQILEHTVNRAKGTMLNDEFVQMCCDVADFHRGVGGN